MTGQYAEEWKFSFNARPWLRGQQVVVKNGESMERNGGGEGFQILGGVV